MRWLTALVAVVIASCATDARPIVNSWTGRHIDDLVTAWGPPDNSHQTADGGRVIAYVHQSSAVYPMMTAYAVTAANIRYACSAIFRTDAMGIIRHATVQGDDGGCHYLVDGRRAAR